MKTHATNRLAITLLSTLALAAIPARAQLDVPLPGLTAEELAMFEEGKELYQHDFTVAEGLGPLFNRTSCVACHFAGGVGGSEVGTANNVTHFGVEHEGRFLDSFEHGGPVQQLRSFKSEGIVDDVGEACMLDPDTLPTEEQMPGLITSLRHTPPVFGFGLIDAIPDEEILKYEGRKSWKKPGVLGLANWGVELESLRPFPAVTVIRPRTVPSGAPRVGRFGWHGATATLFQFSTEPFNIELGVSTPFFPRENHPNGAGQLPEECRVPGAQPNDTASVLSTKLYLFQALLAAPARGPITEQVVRGEEVFKAIGCTDCHRKQMKTVKDYYATWPDGSARRIEALSNKTFEPWSDFLTHDMGPEMDDHRHQGRATGRFWRTTPLWGLRFKTNMLHDGSAVTFDQAIDAHGGEGTWSRDAYFDLPEADKEALDAFLASL